MGYRWIPEWSVMPNVCPFHEISLVPITALLSTGWYYGYSYEPRVKFVRWLINCSDILLMLIQHLKRINAWLHIKDTNSTPIEHNKQYYAQISRYDSCVIMFQWNLQGPCYQYGSTLISTWISNHIPGIVWDWTSNFIPHLIMDMITYLCWD